jgi:hypothetical protein
VVPVPVPYADLSDPENRIGSTTGFTYTYDADGNRIAKVNGTTGTPSGTLYWYVTLGIVGEIRPLRQLAIRICILSNADRILEMAAGKIISVEERSCSASKVIPSWTQ